ncbi:MAG: TonB-dependent receptor [Bacteroidota bacterium]
MNSLLQKIARPIMRHVCLILLAQAISLQLLAAEDLGASAAAFERTISGTVTDASGEEPLIGATVQVKGTTLGTITDIEGKYQLSVPDDAQTLVVSFLGYLSQELTIGNQSVINASLEVDIAALEEVVVVAYGVQKKSDVTGAVASTKEEDFNKGVVLNPGQLLQGKVAGVNVTNASGEPGAAQNVIIRGIGSLRSGTTPLYVVDGFLLDNTANGVATNPLNFINPDDIASIDVLKDASAAALYGSRASNGVIVITTKRGQAGRTQFSLSASTAWSSMANQIDVFDANEFRTAVNSIGGVLDDRGANTNWQDELTQTGVSQDVNLAMSGGGEQFTYRASVGYQKQEGILKKSELERFSGRLNVDQTAWDGRIKVSYNLTASHMVNLRPQITNTIADMLDLNPTFRPDSAGVPSFLPEARINPVLRNQLYSDEATQNRILAGISPSIEIVKGLVYKFNLGVDYSATTRYIQNEAVVLSQFDQQGSLETRTAENRNTLVENTLAYTYETGRHSATFLVGHSYQQFFDFGRSLTQSAFQESPIEPKFSFHESPDPEVGLTTVVNAEAEENELQSFFGRLDYNFDSKYLLTATFRADGSSKFGEDNRYAYFPSFAAGWNITQESFFNSSFIGNLKLRASWGQTGNQEIPPKITQANFIEGKGQRRPFSQLTYPLAGDETSIDDYPAGFSFVRLANPDIQWEVSTQTNVGLDFALFDFRLTGTIDYFHKVSDNILLEVIAPDPISPTERFWTNVPDLEIVNNGLELSLEFASAAGSEFQWSVGGNFSAINNEIRDSPYKVLTTGSAIGGGQTGATINGYINGEPVGAFYSLVFDGIGEDGFSEFVDLDNDGEITDNDRRVNGSALPNVLYGFYTNMRYKGFDLQINFNGAAGNEIYNHNRMELFNRGKLSTSNNTTEFATRFPNEANTNSNTVSTRYLEDGSFLRLNNASLGYTVTPSMLGLGDNGITNLRVFVTGQNLFVISDYSGFDPEVNTGSSRDGIQTFGIDRLTYPMARTFLIGINANF